MIDWERTELRPRGKQNATHVWVKCDKCKKERWISVRDAHNFKLPGHLCHACATRAWSQIRRGSYQYALGRTCSKCGEYKFWSAFRRDQRKSTGHRTSCRECGKRATRLYRERNPEKALASKRISQAKRRAQKKSSWGNFSGADWELVLEKYGHRCLACGTLEDMQPDHIIPLSRSGVHHKSNIQPLCGKCNRTKQALIIDYRPDAYWADWT